LEHRSASRAISTTGLKSTNQALRRRDGSIENTSAQLVIPRRARSRRKKRKGPAAEVSVPVKRYAKAERYAKAIPVKRYAANTIRSSKQSTRAKPVTPKPIRGRTELASLLQRAFSGY
jgi:hypothetical protein